MGLGCEGRWKIAFQSGKSLRNSHMDTAWNLLGEGEGTAPGSQEPVGAWFLVEKLLSDSEVCVKELLEQEVVCLSRVLEPLACRLVQTDASAKRTPKRSTEASRSLNTEDQEGGSGLGKGGQLERAQK